MKVKEIIFNKPESIWGECPKFILEDDTVMIPVIISGRLYWINENNYPKLKSELEKTSKIKWKFWKKD